MVPTSLLRHTKSAFKNTLLSHYVLVISFERWARMRGNKTALHTYRLTVCSKNIHCHLTLSNLVIRQHQFSFECNIDLLTSICVPVLRGCVELSFVSVSQLHLTNKDDELQTCVYIKTDRNLCGCITYYSLARRKLTQQSHLNRRYVTIGYVKHITNQPYLRPCMSSTLRRLQESVGLAFCLAENFLSLAKWRRRVGGGVGSCPELSGCYKG